MTSWLTVKESVECMQPDEEDSDAELTQELGIFKLRSIYTRGINALHCSGAFKDKDWVESRSCFEEIIRLTQQTIIETAVARSECDLLLFLAYSNLSRILATSNEKETAHRYALCAASMVSISDRNIQDPGLQLRMAKLALDTGDLWSCKHILDYRAFKEAEIGSHDGGLSDSFLQLYDDLYEKVSEQYSVFPEDHRKDKYRIVPLSVEEYLSRTEPTNISSSEHSLKVFNELASVLELQGFSQWSSNYSFQLCFPSIPSHPLSSSSSSFSSSSSSILSCTNIDSSPILSSDAKIQSLVTSVLCDPYDSLVQYHSDTVTYPTRLNQDGITMEVVEEGVNSNANHDQMTVCLNPDPTFQTCDSRHSNSGTRTDSATELNTETRLERTTGVSVLVDISSDSESNSMDVDQALTTILLESEENTHSSHIKPVSGTIEANADAGISINLSLIGSVKSADGRKNRFIANDLKVSNDVGVTVGRRRKESQKIITSLASKFSSLQVFFMHFDLFLFLFLFIYLLIHLFIHLFIY